MLGMSWPGNALWVGSLPEKLKVAPTARGPVGRLEFETWKTGLFVANPLNDVIAMLVLQVTISVLVFPIETCPKSRALQVIGKATGDP